MATLFCGVDFHKRTCTIFVCDKRGHQVGSTKRVTTDRLLTELIQLKDIVVGIEASGGVNHTAQSLKDQGIDVRIINANKSRAIGYGGKKTDAKDAETIAHLLRSDFAPEVALKSKGARDMSLLITAREHLVTTRTQYICHVRGLLREYGIMMQVGVDAFLAEAPGAIKILERQNPQLAEILEDNYLEIQSLKQRELDINTMIEKVTQEDERISRIRDIPGVGLLGAYLMIAVIDDITRFPNSKSFASYLGLVPREDSSGDKRRLGGVTKAGNETLRRYLIHGARAVLKSKNFKEDPVYKWAVRIEQKRGTNKATVALAHKLARICFALLRDCSDYRTVHKAKKKEAS